MIINVGNPVHLHQSEAFGNIAAMLWIRELIKFFGILQTKATIMVECDNLGLCTNKNKKINDDTPDPDAICLIHTPVKEIPGKIIHGHIKGHQDCKIP